MLYNHERFGSVMSATNLQIKGLVLQKPYTIELSVCVHVLVCLAKGSQTA